MKRTTILLILTCTSLVLEAQTYRAYISTLKNDSVYIYDINSKHQVSSLPMTYVRDAASTNSYETIYFTGYDIDSNSNIIYKVSPATETIIKSNNLSSHILLNYIKLSPNNSYLYGNYKNKLYKLDTGSLSVVDSFTFNQHNGQSVGSIDFLNDSTIFYSFPTKTYKYNLDTKTILDSINSSFVKVINDKLYSFEDFQTLKFRDLNSFEKDTSINIDYTPIVWTNNPKNKHLYVTQNIPRVSRINIYDMDSYKLHSIINTYYQPWDIKLSPDGNLWMLNSNKNIVQYADTSAYQITDSINIEQPIFIIFGKKNDWKISTPKITQTHVSLYPNPATNKITLESSSNEAKNFTVINSLGKTVMSFESTGTETEVDVSNLPPGVYFVMLNGDKTGAMKFVKQ